MESNMFTNEQLEILRKGFQAHDFTQSVSLSPEYDGMSPEQIKAFAALKKRVIGYIQSNLPVLDIPRPPKNFAGDHPVNLLTDAGAARYIIQTDNRKRICLTWDLSTLLTRGTVI